MWPNLATLEGSGELPDGGHAGDVKVRQFDSPAAHIAFQPLQDIICKDKI